MKNNTPVITFGETAQKKEPFRFEYTTPSLDWFDVVKVEIKPEDYTYFKLSRRYCPEWWLVGTNPPTDGAEDYHWVEKTIGRISDRDIARFVEWAKDEYGKSRLIEISAISGSFNLLQDIEKLLRVLTKEDAE